MKRKNLDQFYQKKVKIIKEKFLKCSTCQQEYFYKIFSDHRCKPLDKSLKSNPEACAVFKELMKTSQKTLNSDLNLKYLGKTGGRHCWEYSFDNPSGFISKSHCLQTNKFDPRSIILTFSSTHSGSNLNFFSFRPIPSLSLPEMKSLLQKAIRRGNRRSAIRTSIQFGCNFGIQLLCRRLCVILLDDSVLHPDFPLLVWCMGSNDLTYSLEIFESVLQVVADVTSFAFRDLPGNDWENPHVLYEKSHPIVRCILIRAFYKGSKSDVINLWKFALLWNQRLGQNDWESWIFNTFKLSQVVDREEVSGNLTINDLTFQGIDAGCSGIVKYLLKNDRILQWAKRTEKDPEEFLTMKLWDERSGVNSRKLLTELESLIPIFVVHERKSCSSDEEFNEIVLPPADAYSKKILFQKFFV